MAYVKYKNGFEVGDWAITKRAVGSFTGYFEKGTRVKIIGVTERGYDLMDEHGNRITETGFDSVCEYYREDFSMTREEQLKVEYESKLSALKREQNNCNHEWEEVKYDPEIKATPKYEYRMIGSDYMPELIGFNKKKIDRWSRTCKKCGKVEYTKEQVATKYKPKF